MKKNILKLERDSFTVVELVIVLVLVGIFVVFGIPKFVDLRKSAFEAEEEGVFATIQQAIEMKTL